MDLRILRRKEALGLDPKAYNPRERAHANLRLGSTTRIRDDEAVAVVAFDGEEIVGKMLLRYASIPYDGGVLRLALGQDMLVSPDYRGRGIGTALITKSLEVQAPTIHSGLSSLSKPLFEKFALPSIDRSQAYQLALSWKGFLRQSRDRAGEGNGMAARVAEAGDAVRGYLSWRDLLHRTRALATSATRILPSSDAIAALPELLSKRVRRFQIPWNLTKLRSGLTNTDPDLRAIVAEVGVGGSRRLVLATAYRYPRQIRIPFTQAQRPLEEWRVNEIYPPVTDPSLGQAAIAAIAARLAERGADVIEVFCHTGGLESACIALGLRRSITKSMLLVPQQGVAAELTRAVCDPEQWWCRALNEEQFEESQEDLELIVPQPLYLDGGRPHS